MKKVNLNAILEEALEEALASLKAKAAGMVEAALGAALEAKVRELLGEDSPTPTPTPTPTLRARGKAQATLATPAGETREAKPRTRGKAKAVANMEEDLDAILEGVKVALEKYQGAFTPKGKPIPDVLFRRVRKVLEHAGENGHHDLALLARSALAQIAADPRGIAMGSWQNLAAKIGLPIPLGQ